VNPLEATDPWSWLWAIMLWVFWALALVGALILVFAILVGFWKAIRGILPQTTGLRRSQVKQEASGVAESLYGSLFSPSGQAFTAGVDYTLGAIERKPYAGRTRKTGPTKLI
jgi:hypothetical protein